MPEGWNGPVTRILEDNIHSTKQNSTLLLTEKDFDYSHTYGFSRLFRHANLNGYPHDRITGGTLTPEILGNYDILFINLVHDSRPDFTEAERTAILDFVASGGGLFVIADHTNVYEHAQRLNPILEPAGIRIRYETAIDKGSHSVQGAGWILIDDFVEHPVTRDVKEIMFLTGGTMDADSPLAFNSEDGFGDHWNPDNPDKPVGKYGNWVQDEDEDSGPLPLSAAAEYGEGRIFVIGDQNLFGNTVLYFLNNSTIAFNAIEWLGKRENDVPGLRNVKPDGFNIHLDAQADAFTMVQSWDTDDHLSFYFNLSRQNNVRAHSTRSPLPWTPDAFLLVDPVNPVEPPMLAEADDVIASGGQVLLVQDATGITTAAVDFFQHFVPEAGLTTSDGSPFSFQVGAVVDFILNAEIALPLRGSTHTLPWCPAVKCPGHALLTANSPEGSCDLLCAWETDQGTFLLSMAGGFFYQPLMGSVHTKPAGESSIYYEFEMEIIETLMSEATLAGQN